MKNLPNWKTLAWFLLMSDQGKMDSPLCGPMDREPGIMGSHYQLDLEHLPWPVSVLKFNGTVSDMRSGDDMTATLRDPDVVGNLCQLLGSQADLHYEVRRTDSEYRIKVVKKSPGKREKRP